MWTCRSFTVWSTETFQSDAFRGKRVAWMYLGTGTCCLFRPCHAVLYVRAWCVFKVGIVTNHVWCVLLCDQWRTGDVQSRLRLGPVPLLHLHVSVGHRPMDETTSHKDLALA